MFAKIKLFLKSNNFSYGLLTGYSFPGIGMSTAMLGSVEVLGGAASGSAPVIGGGGQDAAVLVEKASISEAAL